MKNNSPIGRQSRSCAGVVLYKPDTKLLKVLGHALAGRRLFAFANGPMDHQILAAFAGTDLRLIESPTNVGLGVGLNAIAQAAFEDGFGHIMLLDQDSTPSLDLLDQLTVQSLALERQENVALIAPLLIPPSEGFYKPIHYQRRSLERADGLVSLDFAPTSGSLVNRRAYETIGPFRDDFFIAGIDVEWGFRAWNLGWSTYLVPGLKMPHRWGEDVRSEEIAKPQILRQTNVRNYYYARNVVATARLAHVPWRWRVKSAAALAAQLGLLAIRGDKGSAKPAWTGLIDGLRGRLGPAPLGIS